LENRVFGQSYTASLGKLVSTLSADAFMYMSKFSPSPQLTFRKKGIFQAINFTRSDNKSVTNKNGDSRDKDKHKIRATAKNQK